MYAGGLTFLCMYEINLETTLLRWPCMSGEKKNKTKRKQHQTLWLDQFIDVLKRTTCLTGRLNCRPPSPHHMGGGGGRGSSLSRSIWTICRGGSSLLKSGEKNSTATFTVFHQPFLKYKRLCGCVLSSTAKMYKHLAGVHFP